MSAPVRLLRRLVLEAPERVADGAGGFTVSWVALGTVWADITARGGREGLTGGAVRPRVRYRIRVRGAPEGAASRPLPTQRLREGARVFDILTVAEHDGEARFLEILAEEGVLP